MRLLSIWAKNGRYGRLLRNELRIATSIRDFAGESGGQGLLYAVF